jgi:predicted metal-binding protein
MDTRYVIVLQCDVAKQRCSGFGCENAFWNRIDAFGGYPSDKVIRYLSMSCSGCPGRSVQRKLSNFLSRSKGKSDVQPGQVAVHFASCICKDNFHGPPCPHYDYIKTIVDRCGLRWAEGTVISKKAEARRKDGKWSRDA